MSDTKGVIYLNALPFAWHPQGLCNSQQHVWHIMMSCNVWHPLVHWSSMMSDAELFKTLNLIWKQTLRPTLNLNSDYFVIMLCYKNTSHENFQNSVNHHQSSNSYCLGIPSPSWSFRVSKEGWGRLRSSWGIDFRGWESWNSSDVLLLLSRLPYLISKLKNDF